MMYIKREQKGQCLQRASVLLVTVLIVGTLLVSGLPFAYSYISGDDSAPGTTQMPSNIDMIISDDVIADASLGLAEAGDDATPEVSSNTDIGATGGPNSVEASTKWYVIDSTEPGTDDAITYDEAETNINEAIYISSVAHSDVVKGGLTWTPLDWIFFMNDDSSDEIWMRYDDLAGTLETDGGSGWTAPTDWTIAGGKSVSFKVISRSKDGGAVTVVSKTFYFARMTHASLDPRLYVDDDTLFNTSSDGDYMDPDYVDEQYDEITIKSNDFVLTSAFPTTATSAFAFKFGNYIAYDGDSGTAQTEGYYMLLCAPQTFPASADLDYTVSLTAAEHSVPA